MRRFVSVVSPVIVLGLAGAACGPAANVGPKGPAAATTVTRTAMPPAESPARWLLHPTHGSSLRAKLDLGAAGTLYVGDGGERWLDKKDGTPAIPSTSLLPESLVGATRAPDGKGLVLVGQSGATYAATDPLGAPVGNHPPPRPLRSLAAGRVAIVAIADDGALMRSADAGASWAKVSLPTVAGTLVQVAMNDQGSGLALVAPQRVFASTDDGATWAPLATPSIGARRVVLDVNGDLVLEGLEASAVLKASPTRFERIGRAPKSDAFDLGGAGSESPLGYARAVATGRGALVGDRYVEALADADDPTHWRVAIGPIGQTPEPRKVPELNGCTAVFVGGEVAVGGALVAVCDGQGKKPGGASSGPSFGSGPPPKWNPNDLPSLRVYRSDDAGKSWRDDGTVGSAHVDTARVWMTPDHALVIDGACKKSKYGCTEGPPLVRVASGKAFAKVGVPKGITRVSALAFAPSGTRAYGLARGFVGPLSLLISTDGGKDFTRTPLPSLAADAGKKDGLSASHLDPGSVAVDEAGVVYATAHLGTDWALFTSSDDGLTLKGKALPFKADAVSMVGKRGFAYERHGRGWESIDGGATWSEVGAPPLADAAPALACGAYGCLIGDRATRVGWGGPGTGGAGDAVKPVAAAYATPLRCKVDGAWTTLGAVADPPTAYESELGAARWMAIKSDGPKGSVAVVVGKPGPKGLETREVSLFGAAPKDTATATLPQVEGVAAVRYAFKREKAPKQGTSGAIVAGQKVDVEVAWWIASTNKVHHATIHGAGPLDPKDVITSGKDSAARASIGLLSIAAGGVHVRPFASRPEAPLYFVHDGGKVDRLAWPELPSKDAGGQPIAPSVDAVRVGDRSVIVAVSGPGLQLFTAWANAAGTAWEPRTWGIWPELHAGRHEEVAWDFTYVKSAPAIVALWGGGASVAATGWAVPIQSPDADPAAPIAVPTQRTLADPPRACDDAAAGWTRVVAPFVRGSRHPVVVQGEGNELVLATTSAVLRGAGSADVCALAFEAHAPAGGGGTSAYSAVIAPGDLANAALFKASSTGQELSVRPMSCTFAAGTLPASLVGVDGFD